MLGVNQGFQERVGANGADSTLAGDKVLGGDADIVAADEWFQKVAESGEPNRLYSYAQFLHLEDTKYDPARALGLYEMAMKKGHLKAQNSFAQMLADGEGCGQDQARARGLYLDSAEKGDIEGQFNLAVMLQDGEGGKKDLAGAEEWYLKAALQGHVYAATNYASLLRNQGKHLELAREWYGKAAEKGDSIAQERLAEMLRDGKGGAVNAVEARKWFHLAAIQEDK